MCGLRLSPLMTVYGWITLPWRSETISTKFILFFHDFISSSVDNKRSGSVQSSGAR
jgi:hypothetical protein